MKRILFCAAFLLAACNQKQSTETSQQQAPPENGSLQTPTPPPVPAVPSTARQSANRVGSDDAVQNGSAEANGNREPAYVAPAPQSVVSVYVDPPLEQPPPVRVAWAPPPMLVEDVPPPPSAEAVWTGGYWVWQGDWVWAHGRWAEPPRRNYHWQSPYYEHRGDSVVFVDGYWRAPERAFVPPPQNAVIAVAVLAVGIIAGERPHGPGGVFVPPPPGSHRGLIVPAPLGTPPSVVMRAPPIIREGMHITVNNHSNNTTVNNTTNITNIQNITNVTLVAPAGSTATGQAIHSTISTNPHVGAAQSPVVQAMAPMPQSSRSIPAYASAHAPAALPAPQRVNIQAPGIVTQQKPGTGLASSEPYAARDKPPHATGPAHPPEPAAAHTQTPATAAGHVPETAPGSHQGQAQQPGGQNEHNREHASGPGATPSASRNAVGEPHGRAQEPVAPAPLPHETEGMTKAAHASAAPSAEQHEIRSKMQIAALDKHSPTAVKPAHQDGKPRPANEHKPKEPEEDKKNE